jgi:hypothetical protein
MMQKFSLLPKVFKVSSFFFVFLSLFFIKNLLFISLVQGADYQCSPEESPEYHSLRPYPGDPCNQDLENLSYSCGNTMIIKDTFSVLPEDSSACAINREQKTQICYFNVGKTINISVDTSASKLPIAGLTEGDFVVNSEKQPDPEGIDDETKMSEYLSWYLSGVPDRAEYSPDEDINKSINLAGPIKKLLPWLVQNEIREEVVGQAGDTRHNQVIGCLDNFNQAVACYPQRPGVKEIRLSNWEGNLSSSYIPFSSTEDLKGELSISKPGNAGSDITIKPEDISFTGAQATTLYFPHLQEGSDLADALQPTYKAKDLENGSMGDIQPPKFESGCKILEVRSNEGDKLLGGTALGTLSYKASFECTFNLSSPSACIKQAVFASEIDVSSPKADDLWTKLVSGTSGVVRRIFPKFGFGGLGSLIDLPAVTTAAYSSGAEETSPTNANIYIPHLGGVSEYFLKGIQTMLRPKGYGESITFGSVAAADIGCDSEDNDVNKAMNDASSKYGVPAKLLYAIFRMESPEYISNPDGYVCKENEAGAAGVMQIIPSTYTMLTCEDERLENSLECSPDGKLSRCEIHDAFELAARALMWHAGVWPSGGCKPSGKFPNNKQDIYKAACGYYGSFSPDAKTRHAAQQFGLPDPENKNYCDVVCFIMGDCPPFP